MFGKQPKIKKEQRWRYLEDGITKISVEEDEDLRYLEQTIKELEKKIKKELQSQKDREVKR